MELVMPPQIRWMIRRDLEQVIDIEQACYELAWTEEDFLSCLRQRNNIGMVAEDEDGIIVGYMIYELEKNSLHVINFAVCPTEQRKGIGSEMVAKLKQKLRSQSRERIYLQLRESNLGAQLFFQRHGFRCVGTLRKYYPDNHETAYRMQFDLKRQHVMKFANRISEFPGDTNA